MTDTPIIPITPMTRIKVRLGDFGLARENARYDEPADDGIPQLAETLLAAGVVIPPIVRPGRKGEQAYEHFEAGKGPLYVDRIHDFANALGVDPHAILLALEIGSPDFAVRCADSKLMTIIVMALQDFDAATGDAISQLDAQTLRSSFERLFGDLGDLARARAALAEGWLDQGSKPKDGPKE